VTEQETCQPGLILTDLICSASPRNWRRSSRDDGDGLRALLIGTSTNLWLDVGVLALATVAAITAASLLLPRLAR
jgi:hypothetical protein